MKLIKNAVIAPAVEIYQSAKVTSPLLQKASPLATMNPAPKNSEKLIMMPVIEYAKNFII